MATWILHICNIKAAGDYSIWDPFLIDFFENISDTKTIQEYSMVLFITWSILSKILTTDTQSKI